MVFMFLSSFFYQRTKKRNTFYYCTLFRLPSFLGRVQPTQPTLIVFIFSIHFIGPHILDVINSVLLFSYIVRVL